MSNLRLIMQRLAEIRHNASAKTSKEPLDRRLRLKYQMDEYQQNLERCSTEMLHYEWAWLNEHIEALELSLVQPEMCKELGGPGQAKNLLEENKEYQMLLQDYFRLRMIHPVSSRYPISPGEHAWELSNESIKEAWGIG